MYKMIIENYDTSVKQRENIEKSLCIPNKIAHVFLCIWFQMFESEIKYVKRK